MTIKGYNNHNTNSTNAHIFAQEATKVVLNAIKNTDPLNTEVGTEYYVFTSKETYQKVCSLPIITLAAGILVYLYFWSNISIIPGNESRDSEVKRTGIFIFIVATSGFVHIYTSGIAKAISFTIFPLYMCPDLVFILYNLVCNYHLDHVDYWSCYSHRTFRI